MAIFQAMTSSSEVSMGPEGCAVFEFIMRLMPTVSQFQVVACAPCTGKVAPPPLPSKTWPYLSTRKL